MSTLGGEKMTEHAADAPQKTGSKRRVFEVKVTRAGAHF
jgi:hypothetical protein